MADSLTTSKTHRLPYSFKIGLIVIGFMLLMPIASAETVKLLENTDICKYMPGLDMDYCYSKYEICDLSLSYVEKSTFKFQDEKSGYKDSLSSIYSSIVSIVDKGVCKELTIQAWKSPFKNVDNVLCTQTKCYYEYVWWNSSFLFKFPINASTSSGQVTLPILINDSSTTINNSVQYIWCNYTVNTTRRVVGYLYFTNETLYRCVDETETFSVAMGVDEGNGESFGDFEDGLLGFWGLNDTVDMSRYGNDLDVNGDVSQIAGMIGSAQDFDGSGDFLNSTIDELDNLENVSACVWARPDGTASCAIITRFDRAVGGLGTGWLVEWLDTNPDQYGTRINTGTSECAARSLSVPAAGIWTHICLTYDNSTVITYVNGVPVATNSGCSGAIPTVASDVSLGAGKNGANYDYFECDGRIDTSMVFNRTLSPDEVQAIFNNTIGIHNFAPLGPVVGFEPNTALLAINEELGDFIFSDSDFIDTNIINFNTSSPNTTFLLLSSMNIEKLTAGGTNVITVRIILDSNETILEEDVRTVSDTGEIGSSGTSPVIFSVASGEHNITYQFKSTGPGNINISNFDFNLIQFVSSDGNRVRNQIVLTDFNHTDTSFTTAFNWTMNKTINSSTFILVKNSLTKSGIGSTVATYFFENLLSDAVSPFWQRFLSDSSDIGSVSGIHIDPSEVGEHNHSIESSQSDAGDVVFANGSLVDFDLVDSDELLISFFRVSNESTNLNESINLSSGTHLLAESEVLNNIGNSYFIAFFSSFSSTTGAQTPRYFIDSPNLTTAQCFTEKLRTLSDNNDIGNAFAYTICDGLSVDERFTFRLWVDVETGETLTQLDENLLGFETINFSITEGQVAPIASIITNPINGTNVSGSDTITWLPFFDPNGDTITYNVTLVNPDGTDNLTIGLTNSTSLPVNWNSFVLGDYFLRVEGCDPGDLCGDTNISMRIVTEPALELSPSITFCENSDILRSEENTRTITNGNTTDETEITRVVCQYGCSNWTISTFGNPGCEEGDFWLALVFIIVLILVILIIRGAAR